MARVVRVRKARVMEISRQVEGVTSIALTSMTLRQPLPKKKPKRWMRVLIVRSVKARC